MTTAETNSAHVCTGGLGGSFGAYIANEKGEVDVLIISPAETEFTACSGITKEVRGTTPFNGMVSTHALAQAGSDAAKHVLDMRCGGYSDWFIPTRLEFLALYLHAKETFTQQWYLTSTQNSRSAPWVQGTGRGSQVEGSGTARVGIRAIRRISKSVYEAQIQGAAA